jgi:hypothetical protein
MAVHYQQSGGGGGLWGTLGRIVGAASMFIPGLQPIAPFINAGLSLASGDPMGAMTGIIAGPLADEIKGAQAAQAANSASLRETLYKTMYHDLDGAPRLTDTPAQYRRFIDTRRR